MKERMKKRRIKGKKEKRRMKGKERNEWRMKKKNERKGLVNPVLALL